MGCIGSNLGIGRKFYSTESTVVKNKFRSQHIFFIYIFNEI